MFKISRRLDYGLQLMVALSTSSENKSQSTASLAERLQIPLPFLHQIGHSLMQAGMIKATPGPRGGLRLSQPPENITILQIVETLEGKISVNPNQDCSGMEPACATANQLVWDSLQEQILSFLGSLHLDQIASQEEELPFFSVSIDNPVAKIN